MTFESRNGFDFSRLHEGIVGIPASLSCLGCAMIGIGRCKEATHQANITGGRRKLELDSVEKFRIVHIYLDTQLMEAPCGVGQALAQEAKKPVVKIHT